MNARAAIAATGAGATAFLAVAVALIELLPFEFSALVGLPVGIAVGLAVLFIVWTRYDRLDGPARFVVDAAAGFGIAVLAAQVLSYANLGGLRSTLTLRTTASLALLVAGLTALVSWWDGR